MRLRITARSAACAGLRRGDLEERLRLLLGSWTCRIRQAKVCIEDVPGPGGRSDVRCVIEAALLPSGNVAVQGAGTDLDTAVRGAARQLVTRVKDEFRRTCAGTRAGTGSSEWS